MNAEHEGYQHESAEPSDEKEREAFLLEIADRVYELMRKDIRLGIARGAVTREAH